MPEQTYQEKIDLSGEVRATDLDGGMFTLRIEDGSKVEGGRFTKDQERKVTEALKEHETKRLRVIGVGEFDMSSRKLKKIVETLDVDAVPAETLMYDGNVPPIWEEIAKLGKQVSEKDWAKVPTDLAKNLDHYLYGGDKEDVA
jgi:hypothetical protein